MFNDAFFDALGRWQRGWRRDPDLRASLAVDLKREAAQLPSNFRQFTGPVFRKRHLYRRADQRELRPLFQTGRLDEGGATSWSSDFDFTIRFGDDASFGHPDVVAGAIFEHVPKPGEVVLDVPSLWRDPAFITAAESYRDRGGAEREAIFHFRNQRDQNEIVLDAPLLLDEIVEFCRPGNFDSLCQAIGAKSAEARSNVLDDLRRGGIELSAPRRLSRAAVKRVIDRVVGKMVRKTITWSMPRQPHRPAGRKRKRATLVDGFRLGVQHAKQGARFHGWRRLPSRDGFIAGRWSDGTVVFVQRGGWLVLGMGIGRAK